MPAIGNPPTKLECNFCTKSIGRTSPQTATEPIEFYNATGWIVARSKFAPFDVAKATVACPRCAPLLATVASLLDSGFKAAELKARLR